MMAFLQTKSAVSFTLIKVSWIPKHIHGEHTHTTTYMSLIAYNRLRKNKKLLKHDMHCMKNYTDKNERQHPVVF